MARHADFIDVRLDAAVDFAVGGLPGEGVIVELTNDIHGRTSASVGEGSPLVDKPLFSPLLPDSLAETTVGVEHPGAESLVGGVIANHLDASRLDAAGDGCLETENEERLVAAPMTFGFQVFARAFILPGANKPSELLELLARQVSPVGRPLSRGPAASGRPV